MTDPEKLACKYCGAPDAVDAADGWTQRLDDLCAERCRGHAVGQAEGRARIVKLLRDMQERSQGVIGNRAYGAAADLIERTAKGENT